MTVTTVTLAVWDVDGTLVDSRAVIAEAMDRAFEAAGLARPGYERTRVIVGLSLEPACRAMLGPDQAADDALVRRLAEGYRDAFMALRAEKADHEPLYPGARAAVTRLAEAGWLLAVATGKSRAGLERMLEVHGMRDMFDTLWCADDGPSKPDPHMLEQAMRDVGADRGQTVMIGDTAHDMRMARAAGVRAVGVAWGFHTPEEVVAGGAHEIHHDFPSLHGGLDRWARGEAPDDVAGRAAPEAAQ